MVSERPFAAAQPAVTHTQTRAQARTLALTRCVLNRQSEKNMLSQGENLQRKRFFPSVFRAPENKQINKQTDKQMAPNVEPCLIMKTER